VWGLVRGGRPRPSVATADHPLSPLSWDERAVYDAYLDEAFDGLTRAVTGQDWLHAVGLRTDPDVDPLRDDPRFADAVRRVEARTAGRSF
jgi:hypothetical protein